jgi:hypothetical protein
MSYSKVYPIGTAGSLTIGEVGGVATLTLALSESSGGSFVGAAKGTVSVQAEVSAIAIIDAGLALLEAKYPSAASILTALQAIIAAEAVNL